jgi:hypothetical protein
MISLETGEGLYMNLQRKVKSKGVKQRTHSVKVVEGIVYLVLNNDKNKKYESDFYDKNTVKQLTFSIK